jgi:hypothetical protein
MRDKRTTGPSTALRSGRDDKFVANMESLSNNFRFANIVNLTTTITLNGSAAIPFVGVLTKNTLNKLGFAC